MKRVGSLQDWLAIVALVITSALIWFFADSTSLYFEMPWHRVLLILLLWLGFVVYHLVRWLWRQQREAQMVSQLTTADPAAADQEKIKQTFTDAMQALRQYYRSRHGRAAASRWLYDLPWFTIIGPPGSGKTTTLINSELNFPLADQYGRDAIKGVGGTRLCEWWFADSAVLIDTAGRFTSQSSDRDRDQAGWLSLLQSLKKFRPAQPLNGILVVLSVDDLLDEIRLQKCIENIRMRLEEIHQVLSHRLPVYIVINKIDMLSGFDAFFGRADVIQRNGVWGYTVPGARPADVGEETIRARLLELHAQLKGLRLDLMAELANPLPRSQAFLFPEQFLSVVNPAARVFASLAEPRLQDKFLVRGLYFTSATQNGTVIDKVLSSMGLRKSTPPSAFGMAQGKAFFINDLLKKVVIPEAGLVSSSDALRRQRLLITAGLCLIPVCGLLVSSSIWLAAFVKAKAALPELKAKEAEVRLSRADLPMGDFLATSDYLGQIARLANQARATQNALPLAGLGLNAYRDYAAQADYIHLDSLRRAFARAVFADLEAGLARDDGNTYQFLKAYIALASPRDRAFDEEALATLVVDRLVLPQAGAVSVIQRDTLITNLTALLKARPIVASSALDQPLIERARQGLRARGYTDVAYSVLQSRLSQRNLDFVSADAVGPSGTMLFGMGAGKPFTTVISGFYTRAGYEAILKGKLDEALDSLNDERHWVLGETTAVAMDTAARHELKIQVLRRYLTEYAATWSRFAGNVMLADVRDLGDAQQKIRLLTVDEGALTKLSRAIIEQTALISYRPRQQGGLVDRVQDQVALILQQEPAVIELTRTTVDKPFEPLYRLYQDPEQKAGQAALLALFKEIETQLLLMEEAAKTGQPAPDSMPLLVKVRAAAGSYPAPVAGVLQGFYAVLDNLGKKARGAGMGGALSGEVATTCSKIIAGRYPFVASASKDVEFADFAKLFAATGSLATFFEQNLKPLVDTTGSTWRAGPGANGIGLSQATISTFQRAQRIRNGFFYNAAATPYFSFEMRWTGVPDGLQDAVLELDGQNFALRDSAARRLNWPALPGGNFARLTLAGQPIAGMNKEGPWAILRLLDSGRPRYLEGGQLVRLSWNLPEGDLQAELRATSMDHPFIPEVLRTFQCPDKL